METDALIEQIAEELQGVAGVRAIVLGGSRARGTHTPGSDVDLGLYYDPAHPLDLSALSTVAARIDDGRRADLITPIGGWGPWINGGGWLKVQGLAVDFIYRDLAQVEATIAACLDGRVSAFYQPGHPHAFTTAFYLGEVAVCRPLWDPAGVIAALKQRVTPYPDALQRAEIQAFAWEIDFSVGIAHKSIARADVVYAAGCCFRAAACMLHVLFALNKAYWLNEKGALALTDTFAIKPAQYRQRVEEIFRLLDADPCALEKAITFLEALSREVTALAA